MSERPSAAAKAERPEQALSDERDLSHEQAPLHRQNLARLAIEYWRLLKFAERALGGVPTQIRPAWSAQLRYSTQRLSAILADSGLRAIGYEGQDFEPNLPVTVVNAEDAAGFPNPAVERTLEPTITAAGEILALGKVALFDRR